MMRVAGVLAFAALLLIAGVTEAPAVAFNSVAGTGTCSGIALCPGGVVAINAHPVWANPGPGVWVSYAQTGMGGVVPPNTVTLTPAGATETFSFDIADGFTSLSLLVWADDTAGVRLDNGASYIALTGPGGAAPNPTQSDTCAQGALTCTGAGTSFFILLDPSIAHTIQFDVFQRGMLTFGLNYSGDLSPVPEPTSLLLVGSALAAAGFMYRRRLQKNQT